MYRFAGVLLACFALSQGRTLDGDSCGNWRSFNGNCYLFPVSITGTHSWYEARDHCNQLGAHLLTVHSSEENDFVNGILGNVFGGFFNDLWLGLNDIDEDDNYEWSDGSPIDFVNVRGDITQGLQRCVGIDRINKPIQWRAYYCNDKLSYVCKRPQGVKPSTVTPTPTTITPGNCPAGWVKIGSSCVRVFGSKREERGNWSEALKLCQQRGPKGTLVTVNNEQEQVRLTSLLIDSEVNAWIGANKQPYVDYRWTDSTRFDYTNWGPFEPTSQHFFDTCVFMQNSVILPGKWKTSRCKEKFAYVCQITPSESIPSTTPLPPNCPTTSDGYRRYGNACFKLHDASSAKRTWLQAYDVCRQEGGQLASINNGLEQNYVNSLLLENERDVDSLWLGLKDNEDGVFGWSNKWPVYYTNWADGQPKQSSQIRCVFLETETKQWNATSCDDQRGFVCKVTTETPPIIPENPDKMCPSHVKDWTNLGTEFCYYIENGKDGYKTKSWGEALSFCLENDASFVSLHNQHDIDILIPYIQLSGVSMWTGLLKKYHGGFEWQDGTKLDYDIWDEGEPAIFNNPKCGALASSLKCEANDCNRKLGFVCKIPMVQKPTTPTN